MSVANMLNLSHRFRLISGDAVKTIPKFVQENRGLRFSLLNLDFDVYEPTAAALKHLLPLLVPGGIVIIDEYGNKGWGEWMPLTIFLLVKPSDLNDLVGPLGRVRIL
jgi:hypothetical protein